MEIEQKLDQLPKDLIEQLQKIANEKKATIISFVAPQEAIRTSPATIKSAEIEETEMYRLEKIVKESLTKNPEIRKLHLIVHTPGGELHTSYKIARFLRKKFDFISAFIPYEAASGGTLLCCAANELYFGELGNITPIDPQIRYKNTWVSAYSFARAVNGIKKMFGEMSPIEVPTPWCQMSDKLDPIIYDEMNALILTTMVYGHNLLKKSGYENQKAISLIINLTKTIYSHQYPIFDDEAKNLGFLVKEDEQSMKVYTNLVSLRSKEKSPYHCIDYFIPKIEEKKEIEKPLETIKQ
ncbi:MAG: hypothetical protein PHE52_02660 [Candidatus Pacebacteria bacterium]|nr:hypothetical protein [Candidatus Paceibacterota bacterium]